MSDVGNQWRILGNVGTSSHIFMDPSACCVGIDSWELGAGKGRKRWLWACKANRLPHYSGGSG